MDHSFENLSRIVNLMEDISDLEIDLIENVLNDNWANISYGVKSKIKTEYQNNKRISPILENNFNNFFY